MSDMDAHLLIVDDDPAILTLLESLLADWGFRLQVLSNPQQFWETMEHFDPDMVLLDVEMPHIDGFELCQVIRSHAQWQHLPIVFLSVHSDRNQKDRAFTLGADAYITKPIQGKSLATRLLNRLKRSGTRLKWEPLTG